MDNQEMIQEIQRMKKEKNAVILAHNYQIPEIQDVADIVGDSLKLSQEAAETDAEMIIFCGVHFMAESAKILSPQKKVLLPVLDAGCPMADMITAPELAAFKEKHPGIPVVCYVNTSAAVKALCDVACTSSNAVKIVKGLGAKQILFVPDRNLAHHVQNLVPEVEIIPWEGFCITHERVELNELTTLRAKLPGVPILVHPECNPVVTQLADFVGSTSQIIAAVRESNAPEFIIGTEMGILHTLRQENPGKEFHLLSPALICYNMKKTGLADVYRALKDETHEITLDEALRQDAYRSLERMLALS